MNDASAAEMLGKALGVSHVVPMSQEDVGDAAKGLQTFNQGPDEFGRIDQPVAVGVLNEVAVAAIRLGRGEAAIEDRLFDEERKVLHHALNVVVAPAAN